MILQALFRVAIAFTIGLAASLSHAQVSPAAKERLGHCDPKVALAAAHEIVNDPKALNEPVELFTPALAMWRFGDLNEAIFWFNAAQLRMRYQIALKKDGNREQVLGMMISLVGGPINNSAYQDIPNLVRILDLVLQWDEAAPNPLRAAPRTPQIEEALAAMYKGARNYKEQLLADKDELERKAKLSALEFANVRKHPSSPCKDGAATVASNKEPSGATGQPNHTPSSPAASTCAFPWKRLPAGTKVFAGTSSGNGEDAGFPIDTSGFDVSYRDVVVDQPGTDVALLLSMSTASLWRISWTPGTRIVAVWASGDGRQAVVGIPRSTPLLLTHAGSPCGSFTFGGDRYEGAQEAARRAFGQDLTGQFTLKYDRTVIGVAHVRNDAKLLSSNEIDERSYEDPEGYAYGRVAMKRLERDGSVRRALRRERTAWKEGWRKANGLPPAEPEPYPDAVSGSYIMLRPFTLPKGLSGANRIELIIPAGMKPPAGDPGHSTLYFHDGFVCRGATGCPSVDAERRAATVQTSNVRQLPPLSQSTASSEANAAGTDLVQASDLWTRSNGKWYFEVSYDVGAIARDMKADEAYVMIGCLSGREPRGFLGKIGQEHKQRPVRHVGIAVDFEKGLVANRVNGEWSDGDPLTGAGRAFSRSDALFCGVMSTEDLLPILRRAQVMQINWGEKPFRSLPPPGYKGYGEGLVF